MRRDRDAGARGALGDLGVEPGAIRGDAARPTVANGDDRYPGGVQMLANARAHVLQHDAVLVGVLAHAKNRDQVIDKRFRADLRAVRRPSHRDVQR